MKGPETDRLYIDHIETCIRHVQAYVSGDSSRVERDQMVCDAVVRNLPVMAESTQRLSDEIKSTEPPVPWRRISGFRHRLVHDYFNIDTVLIVRVVDRYLPELLAAVSRMKTKT